MQVDLDSNLEGRDWIKPAAKIRALARAGVPQSEIVRRIAVEQRWTILEATEHVAEVLRRA
jgi:hypothetical protein